MMHELDKADYSKAFSVFTKLKNNAAIESIFNHKNEARIFVDSIEKPESVFILNSWAYYYLAGDSENDEFNSSLADFLENEYFPECIKDKGAIDFAFYPDTDGWCEKVEEMFSHLNLSRSGKTYFNYDKNRFDKNWRERIPSGFSITRISPDVIRSIDDNAEFVEYIRCFWETVDDYFQKGSGYCAVDGSNFATICISVFASENDREIGIKTFEDYRRKGLAYVSACAYIEECLENGFDPIWSCFSENSASVSLAEKLGYEIVASHPIYFADIGKNEA